MTTDARRLREWRDRLLMLETTALMGVIEEIVDEVQQAYLDALGSEAGAA